MHWSVFMREFDSYRAILVNNEITATYQIVSAASVNESRVEFGRQIHTLAGISMPKLKVALNVGC